MSTLQPTFIDTLNTLVAVLTPLVPGVTITATVQDIDNPILPSITLFPMALRDKRIGAGSRGQMDGAPESEQDIYGFVYLHAPAQIARETKQQAILDMYQTLVAFRAAFAKQSVYLLADPANHNEARVMSCGDLVDAHFDPRGPYINYLDQLFIGCYGRVSCRQIYADVIYDV